MRRFACSWSGGKDSCLSLYRMRESGWTPVALLTVMTEYGDRTRSHGLPLSVIEAQAAALGLELRTVSTSWSDYRRLFLCLLRQAMRLGITDAVFGDIDTDSHRSWEEGVCRKVGMQAHLPLWKEPREVILGEWWSAGFTACLIAVNATLLDRSYLGRELSPTLAKEFAGLGIDACGENGEFHTLVTDGPVFSHALELEMRKQVLRDGYWFQDVGIPLM